MNRTRALRSAALILAVPLAARATEWQAMGPRAMGMGGAGVASVQGPLASYWNPGALGLPSENSYGLAVPFGVHAALTGTTIEGANDLKNLKDSNSPTSTDIANALSKLNDPNDGLRVNAAGGADLKIGKVVVFLNGFLDLGATPSVDLANTAPSDITSGRNNSELIVRGAQIAELGAGYGHELPFVPGLYVGGDLKIMKAKVGRADYFVLRNNDGQSDIISSLKDNAVESSRLGVDLGALWDVDRTFENAWWRPRVGLVGRNLNNPKFDQPVSAGPGKYAVNPQLRLGGEVSPFNWWHLVSDIDLTNNHTAIDSIDSRQFGVGTEVDVFNRSWINIPLRFGVARNLANTGAGTLLTGGAGLNFLHVILDASAQVSPQRVQTQSDGKSTKTPREAAVGVQLSFLFGGSDDHDRAPSPAAPDQVVPTTKAAPAAAPAAPAQPTPAQADKVKKDAAKAQKELDRQAPPAPAGN